MIDSEVILMNVDSGAYFTLNEVGSSIWQGIVDGKSQEQIIACIVDEYAVDAQTARSETLTFLERLLSEKIILEKHD